MKLLIVEECGLIWGASYLVTRVDESVCLSLLLIEYQKEKDRIMSVSLNGRHPYSFVAKF